MIVLSGAGADPGHGDVAAGRAGVHHGAGRPAQHGAGQEQCRHKEAAPGDQEEQVECVLGRLQPRN